MANKKYQSEISEFHHNFHEYKNSRIVLYGIGRYTATIVEGVKEYNIVGLMDRNPSNIGKKMFGIPILDAQTVEKEADIVIINTAEAYWNVIYERIKNLKIPIYYKNGLRAEKKKEVIIENPYIDVHRGDLIKKIKSADVISVDFFDTLFMRRVCNPGDVFDLIQAEVCDGGIDFSNYIEVRNKAKDVVHINYNLDELYAIMYKLKNNISWDNLLSIKKCEIEIEKRLLVPRKYMLDIVSQYCNNKKLYITTDMYLPEAFYHDIMQQYSINGYKLLLSNKEKKSKEKGDLYDELLKNHEGENILHIGDNIKSDIEKAKEKGIQTFFIPSAWEMFSVSKLRSIIPTINEPFDSVIVGLIISDILNSPFAYDESEQLTITSCEQMGYVVFGPVILTFLLWLKQKSEGERLIFMSRDGFFLQEDYDLLNDSTSDYIYISRQLAMTAAIDPENYDEIIEYSSMPYSGSMAELMEDRFGNLRIEEGDDNLEISELVDKYKEQIVAYIKQVKNNYLNYLENKKLDEECAVVDIGYYGNNQKYLNRLLNLNMKGYYFNADLSKENPNITQPMYACFQNADDFKGEHSSVLKKQMFIESFLTAPYGMIKSVDNKGNKICAPRRNNQFLFRDKQKINEGVKKFICDYKRITKNGILQINTEFIDNYYGVVMENFDFSDEVKKTFYNDNAMMNRFELMLFY